MNTSWLIKGGRIIDPFNGTDDFLDMYVEDGIIQSSTEHVPDGTEIIDATDLVIAPGFTDLHVHFRSPGNEEAEDNDSGALSAAKGGFTSVVTMPNTSPAVDNAEMISSLVSCGEEQGNPRFFPTGCLTSAREGKEIANIAEMASAGAVAFTDDGSTVEDDSLMEQAMIAVKESDSVVMDHALCPDIAGAGVMREGPASQRLGLPGIPALAEVKMVERDIQLAEKTGCSLHIQHISTKGAVDLIRAAQERGVRVSGEITPHHLLLTEDDVQNDAVYKMSPPLGSEEDRDAMIEAIKDGTITCLATDHAPHTRESKKQAFIDAPFGVIGLETAVGATFTALVENAGMSVADWISLWTVGPASVVRTDNIGLVAGQRANITLLDVGGKWTVKRNEFVSRSDNTPFEGMVFGCHAAYTVANGALIHPVNH